MRSGSVHASNQVVPGSILGICEIFVFEEQNIHVAALMDSSAMLTVRVTKAIIALQLSIEPIHFELVS